MLSEYLTIFLLLLLIITLLLLLLLLSHYILLLLLILLPSHCIATIITNFTSGPDNGHLFLLLSHYIPQLLLILLLGLTKADQVNKESTLGTTCVKKKKHYREYSRVLEVVTQGGHDQCEVLDMGQCPVHRPMQ